MRFRDQDYVTRIKEGVNVVSIPAWYGALILHLANLFGNLVLLPDRGEDRGEWIVLSSDSPFGHLTRLNTCSYCIYIVHIMSKGILSAQSLCWKYP